MKDADGKDIQVFTEAEVKAQQDKALSDYQAAHPDQSAALATAQAEAATAKAALEAATAGGGGDKDQNFAALRAAVKTAEDKAEKVRTDSLAAIEALKAVPTQEYKTDLLDNASKNDKTLREKIEIQYNALAGMPASTKAEVKARMEAAYRLAADKPMPGMFDNGAGGMGNRGNGGMPRPGETANSENDNSKAIRGQLGITDEQATKYAPKPGQPGYQA